MVEELQFSETEYQPLPPPTCRVHDYNVCAHDSGDYIYMHIHSYCSPAGWTTCSESINPEHRCLAIPLAIVKTLYCHAWVSNTCICVLKVQVQVLLHVHLLVCTCIYLWYSVLLSGFVEHNTYASPSSPTCTTTTMNICIHILQKGQIWNGKWKSST